MDDFDLNVMAALSALAVIVNEASATGNADKREVTIKSIADARMALRWFADSEFGTSAIRDALRRSI